MFFKIDSTKVSLAEYRYGTPLFLLPLAALIRALRIPLPGSTDDPPVESLLPFQVEELALPEETRNAWAPLAQELLRQGFASPIFHAILDPVNSTRSYWATSLHSSGEVFARIHHRMRSKAAIHLFPAARRSPRHSRNAHSPLEPPSKTCFH